MEISINIARQQNPLTILSESSYQCSGGDSIINRVYTVDGFADFQLSDYTGANYPYGRSRSRLVFISSYRIRFRNHDLDFHGNTVSPEEKAALVAADDARTIKTVGAVNVHFENTAESGEFAFQQYYDETDCLISPVNYGNGSPRWSDYEFRSDDLEKIKRHLEIVKTPSVIEQVRAELAAGRVTIDLLKQRRKEFSDAAEYDNLVGLADGIIAVTGKTAARSHLIEAIRIVLNENGVETAETVNHSPAELEMKIKMAQFDREKQLQKSRDEHADVPFWDAELNAQIWDD